MENRIEINGVWYVREDTINGSLDYIEEEEISVTFSEECVYENDKYCFVASRMRKDGSFKFYPEITVEFTDKRSGVRDTWEKEYWDNNNWFSGVVKEYPESMEELNKTNLCTQGKKQLKGFLIRLVEEGWLIWK